MKYKRLFIFILLISATSGNLLFSGTEAVTAISLDEKLHVIIEKKDISGTEQGSINIRISGGKAPYTTTIFDGSGSFQKDGSKIELNNLVEGEYVIVVQDANMKFMHKEVTIVKLKK